MPVERSDGRESQQKQPTGPTRRSQLNPSPYTTGVNRRGRDLEWEDGNDEFAEDDDSIASNPPRPNTSSIRWIDLVTGRRPTREMHTETKRQHLLVPPRCTASPY